MTVAVPSFAKINLGLRIGAAREDGFHDLLTVYQTIALHDFVRVSVERGSGIDIRCEDPRVPRDESNTCFRMVRKAMEALRAKGRVVVEIEKRLPVQGGLGGASSNAVAALLGLERAVKKPLPLTEKLRLAAEVGSDLPLFLIGGTVLGVGRGEQVYPLEDLPAMACVVVTPEVGVSTPKAFAAWDRRMSGAEWTSSAAKAATLSGDETTALKRCATQTEREWREAQLEKEASQTRDSVARALSGPAPSDRAARPGSSLRKRRLLGMTLELATALASRKLTVSGASDRMNELGRGLSAWLSEAFLGQSHSGAPSSSWKGRGRAENPLLALVRAGIENDFEQVVFPEYPELGEGKRALERAGTRYASLSGSGSALYGLFGSRLAAAKAASALRKQGWAAQATTTLTRRAYWKKIFD